MMANFSIPLRIRLLIAFLVVTGLAVAAVSGISVIRTSDSLLTDTGRVMRARAESEARSIGATLDSQLVRLRALGLGRSLRALTNVQNQGYTGDPATEITANDARWITADETDSLVIAVTKGSVANDLRASGSLDPDILDLMLTDRYGALVAATLRPSDYDQSDEEWWQQAANQDFYIGLPAYDESVDDVGLIIAVAVREPGTNSLVGVLRSTYRFGTIQDLLNTARFGSTGRAELLVNSTRTVFGEEGERNLDDSELALIGQARNANFAEGPFRGTHEILAVAPLDTSAEVASLGWEMLLLQSEDEALAAVKVARSSAFFTALAVLAVAVVAALELARRIVRPIEEVTAAAEGIAAGDLSRRLNLNSHDELGRLAASFNQMASNLEERIAAEQSAQAERLAMQQEMIAAQERRLEELAAPVIPLNNSTLLMPLIGVVDEHRAEQIMHALLTAVAARRARLVLIDLTGVRTADKQVAEAMLHAMGAVRLIGAEVALVGLRPEVARSIVDLDVDIDDMRVYADLQSALANEEMKLADLSE